MVISGSLDAGAASHIQRRLAAGCSWNRRQGNELTKKRRAMPASFGLVRVIAENGWSFGIIVQTRRAAQGTRQ
jgi:hypothetical protein